MTTCVKTQSKRENFPDSLRAFALIGILIANVVYFHSPSFDVFLGAYNGSDFFELLRRGFVNIFIQGKFWSIFSLLFGASLLWAKKFNLKSTQIKRVLLVFLIGLLHYVFIWSGDILLNYGICGMVLLSCLYKDKTILLFTSLFVFVCGIMWGQGDYFISILGFITLYFITNKNTSKAWIIGGVGLICGFTLLNLLVFSFVNEDVYYAFTSMRYEEVMALDNYKTSFDYRVRQLGMEVSNFSLLNILGTMAIGIGIARFIFDKKYVLSKRIKRTIVYLGMACLVLNSIFFIMHPVLNMENYNIYLLMFSVEFLFLTPIAIFYIYLFKRLMDKKPTMEKYLSRAGRMSLSIYITQSLFWVSMGYVIDINHIHYLILTFMAIFFALIQIHIANIYLNKFKYGPLEWVVKKLST